MLYKRNLSKTDVISKFLCGVIHVRVLNIILSHAVDEIEDFEPVQNKPQLECNTESDGMCLIPNLHASWLLATLWQYALQHNHCFTLQFKELMSLSLSQRHKNLGLLLTETQPWGSVYSQVERAPHYLT